MRFSIEKEQFLKALNLASRAIAAKSPIPLLSNVKLELNDRGLEITGTNSDLTVKSTVPYRIGDKEIIRGVGLGSALINAHMLVECVRRGEGQTISLDIIDDTSAKIVDERSLSSMSLHCAKADEYPDIDLEPSGVVFDIKCSDLTGLVERTAFAASTKEQRPVLTAINLDSAGDGVLVATATDSARMARKTVSIDTDEKFVCNIAARTLTDIVRMFEGTEMVRVAIGGGKALFDFDNTVVSSRLISGDYPIGRNSRIIPPTFNYYLEVNAQELVNAIGRVSLFSSETGAVKLSMRDDTVEASAKNSQAGSAVEKLQTFSFNGERLDVSFNPLFVVDAIKALRSEDVTFCFQGDAKPFVIRNPKDDSVVEVVTPLHTH